MNTKSLGTIHIAKYEFEVFEIIPIMKTDRGVNLNIGYASNSNNINKYGDSLFCHFALDPSNEYCKQQGLYCFMVGNCVKYIGECSGKNYSFERRIKDYGQFPLNKVSLAKCKKRGQTTNCRINALINKCFDAGLSIRIGFCAFEGEKSDMSIIKAAEREILERFRFDWNIQLR